MLKQGILVLCAAVTGWAAEIRGDRRAESAAVGITVVAGDIELPGDGLWVAREPAPGASPVVQVQVVRAGAKPGAASEPSGRRMRDLERQQRLGRGADMLSQLWWACREYAQKHDGIGPATIEQLAAEESHKWVVQAIAARPWEGEPEIEPPYVFLVPSVPLLDKDLNPLPGEPKVLAVELHPYVADGLHWVLLSNGQTRRVPPDPALVKTHDLTITPVVPAEATAAPPAAAPDAAAVFTVLGLLRQPAATTVELTFEDLRRQRVVTAAWNLGPDAKATAGPQGDELVRQWASVRSQGWSLLAGANDAPVLHAWIAIASRQHAASAAAVTSPAEQAEQRARAEARRADRGEMTNAFAVLGGRAAIRETLQLEALRSSQPAQEATVPLARIEGVTVESHPFTEMLRGQAGGTLAMADSVPADRFFLYWARPATLTGFLDHGAAFLGRLGAMSVGNCIQYDLKSRYLARLGMDEAWLRPVLASGLVTELGLLLPDLFLVDGTDVTVLARVPNLARFEPLLAGLGAGGLEEGEVKEMPLKAGGTALCTVAGDLLVISTQRAELDAVLAVRQNGGKDSLGQSAEFRYMLTQLPVTARSRAYAYLSDAFIRRLVGPEVKIGQLRRLTALAAAETITAAAMLARVDGQPEPVTLELLTRRGYLPAEFAGGEWTLGPDLAVTSKTWGSRAVPVALASRPVTTVTPGEAEAYKQYVVNYSRYWRQYFDPIAVRLDDGPDGSLELTTFILPLLDNSIYNGLREILATRDTGPALSVPTLEPTPVMGLSLNLSDKGWIQSLEGLGGMLAHYTGLDPQLFDLFGPGLHLFVEDADPVLALGSGDLLGAFGGGGAAFSGGGAQMLAIPVVMSVFTRPCHLAIELQDPEGARDLLRRALLRPARDESEFREVQASFTQYPDRDAWLLAIDLFGAAKLRFGLEVSDRYLIVSNLPWAPPVRVTASAAAALNGATLELVPGAVDKQLPALFTAGAEQERRAAMQGIAYLRPFFASECADAATAAALHASRFGFLPVHPGTGKWAWANGQMTSDTYGSVVRPLQPAYTAGDRTFGLFRDLRTIRVSMQIEDTGLRTVCRWSLAGKP